MEQAIKWSDLSFEKELGEGRAGFVYLAHYKDKKNDKDIKVAVKRYKRWVIEQPGQPERIVRELEIGRQIIHPNLVKTISLIFDPEGLPALVMKYYDGETLDTYLEKSSYSIDINEAFEIIRGICGALIALHSKGIKHRDVKPANIIMTRNGPVLMDLGVIQSNLFPEITVTNQFLGTIRYSAPEMLFGKKYDKRVDIFSLGTISYEIFFSGKYLGKIENWAQLIKRKSELIDRYLGFDFQKKCSILEKKYGLGITDFIRTIINHTLVSREYRFVNLENLYSSLKKRLWTKTFHITGKRIVEGEPYVKRIINWNNNTQNIPLRKAVKELFEVISLEERKLLREEMNYHFWDEKGAIIYPDGIPNSENSLLFNKLESLDLIHFGGHDIAEHYYDVHEVIKQAYRYGYL